MLSEQWALWFHVFQGVTKLRSQASRPPYTCIIPADVVLTPPGGALVHALSDHTSDINCLDLSEDGRRAITCEYTMACAWLERSQAVNIPQDISSYI